MKTPGSAATEMTDMPDTTAKKIAAILVEFGSPISSNIAVLLFHFRTRLSLFPEALLAGFGIARGFDGSYLG
jgi:hypothetical protein